MARKSWQQKLHIDRQPETEVLTGDYSDMKAGDTMLVATPIIVQDYIRQIPEGTFVSPKTMRKDIALQFGADNCCPLTTGIFLRIVSEVAHEEFEQGKPIDQIAPFWRIVHPKSPTAKKLSFGTEFLVEQQQKEHITVPAKL